MNHRDITIPSCLTQPLEEFVWNMKEGCGATYSVLVWNCLLIVFLAVTQIDVYFIHFIILPISIAFMFYISHSTYELLNEERL